MKILPTIFRTVAVAVAATITLAAAPLAASADQASDVADRAAWWIDAQFNDEGGVIGRTGTPDVPNTIAAVLAMDAIGHRHANLDASIAYVKGGMEDYVRGGVADDYAPTGSGDRAGSLANLILFALAVEEDPTDFDGQDLVARLEATEQALGPDAGRFGTQADVFGHTYAHATIVLALASAPGVSPSPAAVAHLVDLQCATGGFPSGYRSAAQRVLDDCTGDSNATGLALAGLAVEGIEVEVQDRAVAFLADVRNDDGGWGYTPGSSTDGNSTGLASWGLRLAAVDVTEAIGAIAGLQFDCTADPRHVGGVKFVGTDEGPNTFATFQAMMAFGLDGSTAPDNPCGTDAPSSLAAGPSTTSPTDTPAPTSTAANGAPALPVTGGGAVVLGLAGVFVSSGILRRR